jgi:hypothetical protein
MTAERPLARYVVVDPFGRFGRPMIIGSYADEDEALAEAAQCNIADDLLIVDQQTRTTRAVVDC